MKRSQTRLILICTTLFSLFSLLPPSSPLLAADFQIMERKAAPVHQGRRAEPAATPAIASPQSRTAPVRLKPAARRMEQLRRLPDLSITRFNATPAKVKSGGKIHLTALVKNSGNISLKGVVIRFTEAAHRKKLGEKVITIGPGKTSRVAITVPMTGKGQVTVLAEVDPKGRIAEGNERNNKKNTTVTIQPARMATVMERHPARAPTARPGRNVRIQEMQPGVTTKSPVSPTRRRIQPRPIVATKPDLAFVRLTSVRKQILQGQSVVIRATVRNNGRGNQHAVPVDFMLDGRKIGSRKVTIPANQTQTCIFRYTAAKSGNHSLVAKIDPGNRIKERNERNNSASIPIVVRPQQQIARSKAADSRNKATASATIATRAATPISIPRPINPAGRGRNLITLQKRSAETQAGSTSPSSRLHGRQAVTQTHKVARTSSTLSRRMQPSKLPVSRAGAENKELRKRGTARTHNGPNMTGRGSKGSGSSSGDIGGLTAGGNPGGSGEPGAGQAPPPFEDDDGLGDIFGGKGTKRPNDKIITPDQMTGKVDTNSPAANLYGPGGKPLPGPGGVAGGRSHHGWRKVGSRKGESQAKHIASVLSIKGPGGQNAGKGALKTTVVKHKNGSLAVIFYHKDGPTIYRETRKGSRKWKCSIFFKAKTVTGSNESMNGSGDKGSKDPLSNSERRDIADARAAEVWDAVNNYTPIQSGGVIDPVRNQANGETGGQGSEKGKGQTGGKKAPRAAHAPGSHRPGSSLTGPGRMDRDPVGKQVKLPQGMHVVDPMAKNELSTGRVVKANKGNNAPVQTTKGNQTHTLIAPPGTVQLKHSSTGGNVAATPISIPRPLKVSTHKELRIPHAVTYDSGPGGGGGGSDPPGGGAWGYDIACSVGYVNGVVPINTKTREISIKIKNNGLTMTPPFKVGLGIKGKARIGVPSSWLKTETVKQGWIRTDHFIYIDFKMPEGITEKTILVAGADIAGTIQEKDEKNNLTTFNIAFSKPNEQPAPSPVNLYPIVNLKNGIYYGDGTGVTVKIVNNGLQKSPSFTVGFGKEKNGKIESSNAWLGKLHVPGVFGGQHVIVTIPWQIHTTGKPRLIVGVDIEGKVDEQDNEGDNYSKPFIYDTQTTSVVTPPALPIRKPFKAFNIIQPKKGERFRAGDDVGIGWYNTQALKNIPAEERSEFLKLDIFLFDNSTGAIVARLAEDARNMPIGGSKNWRVTLPDNTKEGDYYFLLRTSSGTGWGKSDVFTVWHQQTATSSATNKQDSILSHQTEINPAAVSVLNTSNNKTAPKVSIQYLDSVIHTKPHAAGQPEEVKKVVSKYKITTDREIMIVGGDTAFTKPPAIPVYSPRIYLYYNWIPNTDPGDIPIYFKEVARPSVEWHPQGGYSAGSHILTVTYYFTKKYYPLCALKLCSSDEHGLVYDMSYCEDMDFIIWTKFELWSHDYRHIGQGPQIVLRDTGPREKFW